MSANIFLKITAAGITALYLAVPCIVCGLVAEEDPLLPQAQANGTASLVPLVIGTTAPIDQEQPLEETMPGNDLLCTGGQEECMICHQNAGGWVHRLHF